MSDFSQTIGDREWRLRNLYLILDEGGKMRPLELREEQERFLRERHTRNFVPKARKLGMSTVICLDNLDACLWSPDMTAGIIDRSEGDAQDKLDIARFAWQRGPEHPSLEIAAIWKRLHEQNPLATDSKGRMEWSNGSSLQAGVSYVGKTPQRLHVSEYGPISAERPDAATRIKRGSLNSVPPDGIIDIETTMQGGRHGECYGLFKLALDSRGQDLTKMDWRLHFFPWTNHPSYILPGCRPARQDTIDYFAELREKHGLEVAEDRQAWYERRKLEQGEHIYQQFPTVVEECDRMSVPGRIYPEMVRVREEGRVTAFAMERGLPTFTAWDLGSSDNTAGWLIQPAGKSHNFLDWCAGEGEGAAGVAEVIRAWDREYGPSTSHLMPHDVEITDKGSGKTFLQQLVECGIPRETIVVVPRIPDMWVGVDEVRRVLPNAWFHARCDEEVTTQDGGKLPSGVQRMEDYRKKIDRSTGIARDVPVHDLSSHLADACRTYAEALSRDLVRANVSPTRHRRPQQALGGFRGIGGGGGQRATMGFRGGV